MLAPVWAVLLLLMANLASLSLRLLYDRKLQPYEPPPPSSRRRQAQSTQVPGPSARRAYASSPTLQLVLSLIQKSFIDPWYHRISPAETFPSTLDVTIGHSVSIVTERFSQVDVPAMLVSRVIPHLTRHLQEYRKVEHLITPLTTLGAQEIDPMTLLRKHFPPGYLHPALPSISTTDSRPALEAYFRRRVRAILMILLPPSERQSEAAMIIATEILTCCVLCPVIEMLSDPDFWNRTIEEQAEKYLQERKQVTKVRAALNNVSDERVATVKFQDASPSRRRNRAKTLMISADTDTKSFERYVRSLGKIRSLTEARRCGVDIDREIRTVEQQLAAIGRLQVADPSVAQRETLLRQHLNRLQVARCRVDDVLKALTGMSPPRNKISVRGVQVSLRDILTHPSSLGYWMEYADRQGASRLVQFWLTIEAFKDPLEVVASGSDEDEDVVGGLKWDRHRLHTVWQDMQMLWDAYLDPALGQDAIQVTPKLVHAIRESARDTNIQPTQLAKARRRAFQAQSEVYYRMVDELYDDFEETELFQKALTDIEGPSAKVDSHFRDGRADTGGSPTPSRTLPSLFKQQSKWLSFGSSLSSTTTEPKITAHGSNPALFSSSSSPVLHKTRSWSTSSSSLEMRTPGKDSDPLNTLTKSNGSETALFDERAEEAATDSAQIEALQAALSDIMAKDDGTRSMSASLELPTAATPAREKPDDPLGAATNPIRSLSASALKPFRRVPKDGIATSRKPSAEHESVSSRGVFQAEEDDLPVSTTKSDSGDESDPFNEPLLPGDLDLTAEIARLGDKIAKLEDQDAILEKMIHMADLSGKASEVALLSRSQRDLRRELRGLKFRMLQYQQREFDNRIVPGRTRLSVPSATILAEEAGKQIVRYVIEVQQTSGDQIDESWAVARRFNEFYDMHMSLKGDDNVRRIVKHIEPPPKKLVPVITEAFVEGRRAGLEVYLQTLATHQSVCDHPVFRNFLSTNGVPLDRSPGTIRRRKLSLKRKKKRTAGPGDADMVKSLYRQVAGTLDDIFLKPSMLDVVTEHLSSQAAGMVGAWDSSLVNLGAMGLELGSAYLTPGLLGQKETTSASTAISKVTTTTEMKRETLAASSEVIEPPWAGIPDETSQSTFVGPICDFLVELYELKESNWLKKQAVVLIMQQFLGGTIERKVRDTVTSSSSATAVDRYLLAFQRVMWPDGQNRRAPSVPRTDAEKMHSKREAERKLQLLVPGEVLAFTRDTCVLTCVCRPDRQHDRQDTIETMRESAVWHSPSPTA